MNVAPEDLLLLNHKLTAALQSAMLLSRDRILINSLFQLINQDFYGIEKLSELADLFHFIAIGYEQY